MYSHSQLQDEHHVSAVLVNVMQRDDVGVLEVLEDVHLSLDLLSPNTSPACPILPLFYELCSIVHTRTLLLTAFHNSKLPTE